MRVITTIIAIMGVWLIIGCSSQSISKPKFYDLVLTPANKTYNLGLDTLVVLPFTSHAIYQQRALLYAPQQSVVVLQTYYHHSWVANPGRLLQQQLIQYLRPLNVAKFVVDFRPTNVKFYTIQGQIQRFEQLKTPARKVVVALNLQVFNPSQQLVFSKAYQQTISQSQQDFDSMILAYQQAITAIYQQFVQDIQNSQFIGG